MQGMELLQISIPAEWKFLVFIFGALFVIDVFVPMYLYADGTKRGHNGLAWAAGAFFTMAIMEVVGIATGHFGAWVVLTVMALISPYVYLFIYLVLRTPASQSVCASCGRVLESSWSACPYCEGALAVATAGAPAPAPIQEAVQPPGTSMQRRGSTMIRAREEKRTIRRREKREKPALGWLVVKKGSGAGKEYRVSEEQITIGRDSSNDLVVSDAEVSRQHARLRSESDKYILYDLGSANGTQVNGEGVQRAVLDDGDVITVGSTELVFKKV